MRALVLTPAVLTVAVAAAFLVCRATGVTIQAKELLVAAITCLIAGELAAIPMLLTRGGNQASIAQAGLVSSVLHLFVCIAIAGVIILGHFSLGIAYLYWLLAFYWITLIVLVLTIVKSIRSAPATLAQK